MKTISGFIGWRGMVGSTVLHRVFLNSPSTNSVQLFGTNSAYVVCADQLVLKSRNYSDTNCLLKCNVLIATHDSCYTYNLLCILRKRNWKGIWVDASSVLRRLYAACAVLDPLNHFYVSDAWQSGIKAFVGGNCTVSLMILAIAGVLKSNLICTLFVVTFQSASGAGLMYLKQLLAKLHCTRFVKLQHAIAGSNIRQTEACDIIPWIDKQTRTSGVSKEEQKAVLELACFMHKPQPISSICVRVGTLRCHAQCIFVKIRRLIHLGCLQDMLQLNHKWVKLVPNQQAMVELYLRPHKVSSTLLVYVGRLRHISHGFVVVYTIGDQILWGAAEPLYRLWQSINCLYDQNLPD